LLIDGKGKELLGAVFITCVAGWFSAGCASYTTQTKNIRRNWYSGNFQTAAKKISAEAEKRRNAKDAVVWRLEQGAVLRAAGQLEESNHVFDMAEEMINAFEQKARIKISGETLASVSNLAALPYEGFAYDKIMMNTYKALNYLKMGNYDTARVELNRAYERQKDAVYINAARIERAQEEGKKQNLSVDLNRVNNNARFKNQFENTYADLKQFKAYADYVNPLTVYLDALFFMTQATSSSDLERSHKSFERVLGMIEDNKFIQQDLETIQRVIGGQLIPAITYVIFETGLAPERDQTRIDLPLFLITPGVPYVGAAFPKLRYQGNYLSGLTISYDGTTESTVLLASMDAVVAREFNNVLPLILTKTLVASAVKAAATYGASKGVTRGTDNNAAGLAVLVAGTIYQVAMNQADLRTWTTLPKEFQFCRFPTPPDRKIELITPGYRQKMPVTIHEGLTNVVWVKSVNRSSPLIVKQFALLKDNTKGIVSPEAAIPVTVSQTGYSGTEQSIQESGEFLR
jgi:uncharacterized protein